MRSAHQHPDGSIEISKAITTFSKDRDRYDRFRAGEPIPDICIVDGISPEEALKSIRRGRLPVEAEQLLELRDLNHTQALAIARLRANARIRSETLVLDGLERLLTGKRTETTVLKDGQVVTREVVDPEVISMGLEHAIKIMSIAERPAQNSTIVNVQHNQQNNYGDTPSGPTAQTYEERLKRIRSRQLGEKKAEPEVLEAEVIHSETTPIVDPPASTGTTEWEKF